MPMAPNLEMNFEPHVQCSIEWEAVQRWEQKNGGIFGEWQLNALIAQ